jgi:prohibitin 1|tara:strand:+ start:903 stop:1778 length:876 start_codon:yes stop_codon:yes gene_type:complete
MSNFNNNRGGILSKGKVIGGLFGLFSIILLMVVISSWESVGGGEEGFEFVQYGSNKGIDQKTVHGEGKHLIMPWNDFITMNVQEKSKNFKQSVLDKEGLNVTISCAVNYQLRKGSGGWMYSEKGGNEIWDEKIVSPTAKGAIKDVAGKYDAEELYSTKRDQMEVEINNLISERLNAYNVDVTFIEIADVDLPDNIKNAISNKQEQDQKNQLAQKKELEEEFLANAKIQKARGDSASVVINAAGKAAAYKLESRELNPKILRKLELDAWRSGGSQVPTVMGGDSGFIIDLGK